MACNVQPPLLSQMKVHQPLLQPDDFLNWEPVAASQATWRGTWTPSLGPMTCWEVWNRMTYKRSCSIRPVRAMSCCILCIVRMISRTAYIGTTPRCSRNDLALILEGWQSTGGRPKLMSGSRSIHMLSISGEILLAAYPSDFMEMMLRVSYCSK